MTFKTIEYVIAVHETGSFSRAAQRLFISQPALSQAIAKAERNLGVEFFMRDTHTVRLTAAGELLVREGRELLRQRDELSTRISGLSAARNETIRLGISPFYSKYYLPAVIPYFSHYFPSVRLEITEEISVVLEQQVIDGLLDLCFVPLLPQNPRLCYEVIHVEEILLAVPRSSPLAAHAMPSPGLPYIDLKLFENEPFIGLKSIQKFNDMSAAMCAHTFGLDNIIAESGTGIYFTRADRYFTGCDFIDEDILLVYDSNAQVVYLHHSVPEPTTATLSLLALAALAARRRRR